MGRELGEYALETFVFFPFFFCERLVIVLFLFSFFSRYTQVKAVHFNIGQKLWKTIALYNHFEVALLVNFDGEEQFEKYKCNSYFVNFVTLRFQKYIPKVNLNYNDFSQRFYLYRVVFTWIYGESHTKGVSSGWSRLTFYLTLPYLFVAHDLVISIHLCYSANGIQMAPFVDTDSPLFSCSWEPTCIYCRPHKC